MTARVCGPQRDVLSPKVPWPSRIQAASILLDRGYGRPAHKIDMTAILAALDLTRLSDEQLEQMEALISLAAEPLIDQSVQSEAVG